MIRIGSHRYDVDAVVFDKDGTLVHFDQLWASIMSRWLQAVLPDQAPPEVSQRLADALGLTLDGQLIPNGVAHSGTLEEMRETTRRALEPHAPESAHRVVEEAAGILETFSDEEIVPIGNVAATLRDLHEAGVGIAVATSDDRAPAERQIDLLDIESFVDVLVCGDDPIDAKPSAEVLLAVSKRLGVAPGRMAMVGDSETDMLTGRSGGAAVCIGVTGGGGNPVGADLTIIDVEGIEPDRG